MAYVLMLELFTRPIEDVGTRKTELEVLFTYRMPVELAMFML